MRELERLPAVVGTEARLFPKTWVDVRFQKDAALTAADFSRAVARAGYNALRVTVSAGGDASPAGR